MKVGDLVRWRYSTDWLGVVMETRKIGRSRANPLSGWPANSLAIKVWSPDRKEIRWYPAKEYEVING